MGHAPENMLKYMENIETGVEIVEYSTICFAPTLQVNLAVLQLMWPTVPKDITWIQAVDQKPQNHQEPFTDLKFIDPAGFVQWPAFLSGITRSDAGNEKMAMLGSWECQVPFFFSGFGLIVELWFWDVLSTLQRIQRIHIWW